MPPLDPIAPDSPPIHRSRHVSFGETPGFWITCASIFLANAVLSSLYGEWLAALLGLVTTGVSLIAAASSWRRPACHWSHADVARRQVEVWGAPRSPPPSA